MLSPICELLSFEEWTGMAISHHKRESSGHDSNVSHQCGLNRLNMNMLQHASHASSPPCAPCPLFGNRSLLKPQLFEGETQPQSSNVCLSTPRSPRSNNGTISLEDFVPVGLCMLTHHWDTSVHILLRRLKSANGQQLIFLRKHSSKSTINTKPDHSLFPWLA